MIFVLNKLKENLGKINQFISCFISFIPNFKYK